MAEEAKWYIIQTYSGYENKVATNLEKIINNRNLQDFIQEIKIPTEIVKEIKKDKQVEVEKKLFPGYVMIKMILNDDTLVTVRNVRGCTGFVGAKREPTPLSKEEVYKMGIERRSVNLDYAVGDTVTVLDGPLEDFVATVEEIDTDNNIVKVKVSMFGRETQAELELDQVKKLD